MARPDGSVLVALEGGLVLHPWRDPAFFETADAYSLFVARLSALGLLMEPGPGGASGLWGMNDAGCEPTAEGASPQRVAWFQVALARPHSQPLPLQPLIACAADVAERLGRLRLTAVSVTVSGVEPSGSPAVLGRLMQSAGWFTDIDRATSTPVRVSIDNAPPGVLDTLDRLDQTVFEPATGRLAEWTPAAVGWLITLLVHRIGGDRRITVRRSE
jgi:hypothetical protein